MMLSGMTTAASMNGWDIGWNDMATISGGTVTSVTAISGALQYINVDQANVSFETYDMFDGNLPPGYSYSWADATGDQGQHYFDGALRNSWYDGSVPGLTAYDWGGYPPSGSGASPASGSYEWLVNNYQSIGLTNSFIRGTDSSFTYDAQTGEFVVEMTSDGTWYWYTVGTADSAMSSWIKDWDWSGDTNGDFADYYNREMTGNFRLIGTFEDDGNGLPTFTTATLQYEVVPEPATMAILGLGGIVLRRKRS